MLYAQALATNLYRRSIGRKDLVKNAQLAEKAVFDFAAISDHFFPWLDEQGHSPLAWSVLGAIAQAMLWLTACGRT